MALNKDILGAARAAAKSSFNNLDINQVVNTYGSMDGLRLAMEKADSDAIINHFKNNIQIIIPALGLISAAPTQPVTGVATTGTIL